jgi:hypothetical protein
MHNSAFHKIFNLSRVILKAIKTYYIYLKIKDDRWENRVVRNCASGYYGGEKKREEKLWEKMKEHS